MIGYQEISAMLLLVGIVGLFLTIRMPEPVKEPEAQNELVKCWRCGKEAEEHDGGAYWCGWCYRKALRTTPTLLDAKKGETIKPPVDEVMPIGRAGVPWYMHVNRGYNEYFQRKMGGNV